MNVEEIMLLHQGGKLETTLKHPIESMEDLAKVYTPGVAKVCQAIASDQDRAYELTTKKNTVAVISDGTAVLGLGDIGPKAAMPVMEGKAALFKQFADVDAVPICLDTKSTEEIIAIVKALAPTFGGINLEDISSPRCFEIERRLKEELDIPVFHDDQHGTAIVVLAGLLNALKVVDKDIRDVKIVVNGCGAAGISVAKMLLNAGAENLIGVDREGAINRLNVYDKPHWTEFAEISNPNLEQGTLSDCIVGADVFVGVSAPNVLKVDDVRKMAKDPIVFAMANPTPEIDPELAAPYVKVMATGRSDYPNQINNVLCFPGIFRGALDCGASDINDEMKLAVAEAIATSVDPSELNERFIIPNPFDKRVVECIRKAVAEAAIRTGVARNMLISVN
ncbi:malate dehydrogenase (oxaloacetate-decarboxylating) [Paenibacillus sophorae]|uniref:Malate dehydrogenase (Oxaloacetate-decarboxylating) n=2 Tax=Paenibacillus sophorae TaxID=1333845 RepID=A0A1H8JPT4_9BACL|nr:NADP-dependent malic enzyme [Paenibacillus sophorae]QWU13427.1 NADP-dependent malic enzyme [Paenibacillus sophorae]SEN82198.1 malate dehydrogenase (oxaloacetate-decarboxylating) [Paenibacillus sophorae]